MNEVEGVGHLPPYDQRRRGAALEAPRKLDRANPSAGHRELSSSQSAPLLARSIAASARCASPHRSLGRAGRELRGAYACFPMVALIDRL